MYWGVFDAARHAKFSWIGPVADPDHWKVGGLALLLGLPREAARRPHEVLPALGARAGLAGERLGVGRIAAQQPRAVGPAHQLVALGELRQGRGDGRSARADELAEDAVRERERHDHAVA